LLFQRHEPCFTRDIFTQATALLVVTPVDRAAVPTAEVLQGLFDLTPAEARGAGGIRLPQEYGAKTNGRHKPAILPLSFIAALRGPALFIFPSG